LCARIAALVQRVPVARNRTVLRAIFLDQRADCTLLAPAFADPACNFAQESPRPFSRSEDHRAAAEEARSHRSLERLRRGGERHPARLDARHEAMLGDGHQGGIENAALRRRRHPARDEEPEIVAEADAAHELGGEIAPADPDLRVRRAAQGGGMVRRRTDLHFVYRKYVRYTNHPEPPLRDRQARTPSPLSEARTPLPSFRIPK